MDYNTIAIIIYTFLILLYSIIYRYCHNINYKILIVLIVSFPIFRETDTYLKILNDIKIYNIFIGLFMSPIMINLTYFCIYKNILKINKLNIRIMTVIQAIFEEILWRVIILNHFIILLNNKMILSYAIIISIIFTSFIFIFNHNFKSLKINLETFIYTIMLCLTSLYFSGINIGLHIGRNIFIESLKKE